MTGLDDRTQRPIAAARQGSVDETVRALPSGADPNVRDRESGQTVLMIAAALGHVDVVRALLERGADPNALDSNAGTAALHKACQGGHGDVVRVLVEAGAFMNLQTPTTGHTPLVEAIWFAADDIVEYLLGRGARIDLDTYYGFTIDDHVTYALMVNRGSAAEPRLVRIRELVQARRTRDTVGGEAKQLFDAVRARDLDAVRAAIASGVDLEQRWPLDKSLDGGNTPLLVAARLSDEHADIVSALVAAGADVNAVEPVFGAVPLHKATYHGWTEVTKRLAASPGVDLDYQGPSNGYTPLHDALWHAKPACAEALLDAGARADLRGYDGKLPIDIATATLGSTHAIVDRLRGVANQPR